jgi:hypothetical protein
VDRRSTTSRPGSIADTSRVHTIDYAPTRVFRQARHARTPARPLAVVAIDPDTRSCDLAHPRLVRRARLARASEPPQPAPQHLGELEDEPTGLRR